MREFPIQSEGEFPKSSEFPKSIPWDMIAPHEEQALQNHGGQTLERLAQRCGLGPGEALAVLEDRSWHSMDRRRAIDELNRKVAQWKQSQSKPEQSSEIWIAYNLYPSSSRPAELK